jgi:hypothetical protein
MRHRRKSGANPHQRERAKEDCPAGSNGGRAGRSPQDSLFLLFPFDADSRNNAGVSFGPVVAIYREQNFKMHQEACMTHRPQK